VEFRRQVIFAFFGNVPKLHVYDYNETNNFAQLSQMGAGPWGTIIILHSHSYVDFGFSLRGFPFVVTQMCT
jgi:hypothetical protein